MSKFMIAMDIYDWPLIGDGVKALVNGFWRLIYGVYFAFIKAIAWVLDMLTQLFFIFSGMTDVGKVNPDIQDGVENSVDIVNFFLQQDSFRDAYFALGGIALILIVVFAIAKIIKQDYFDRSGPRSKGPIFRNILLSFIAYICLIPIFYFLIDVAGALALAVMKALGYKSGGIGSILFNISWEDEGASIRTVALSIGGDCGGLSLSADTWTCFTDGEFTSVASAQNPFFVPVGADPSGTNPDLNNFGWYSYDTFYVYYWNSAKVQAVSEINNTVQADFYWYTFIFAGLILIVSLGQMILAMVTRMFNLIALFVVAPSPISQIVLDDGVKFKQWKDKVIQEAVKVVGCVMTFMIFIMIVSVVYNLDLMKFAYTPDSASSASNLLESNNLTTELSDSISSLYYSGLDKPGTFDKAINALGRCMIIVAGAGAIKDMDIVITPLLAGGKSSMDMGYAGQSIVAAGSAAAKGALALGKTAIGAASSLASAGVNLAGGVGFSLLKGLDTGLTAGKDIAGASSLGSGAGDGAPLPSGGGSDRGSSDGEDSGEGARAPLGSPTGGSPASDGENNSPADGGNNDGQPSNDGGNGSPGGRGADDANDDPIKKNFEKSREEFVNARENRENAKKNLDEARERDAKKNAILDNMQHFDDLDDNKLTEDEKKEKNERLAKLEQEFNEVDGSGPTLREAQEQFDEAQEQFEGAQAKFQMDSREYQRAYGADETDDGGDATVEPSSGSAGGSTDSENSDNATSTASGAANAADSSDQTSGSSESGNSSGTLDTIHTGKLGGLAKGTKVTLGALGGIAKGAFSAAKGITKETYKASKSVVKTAGKAGLSTVGIVAKTVAGMTGMGKAVAPVEDFITSAKGSIKDGYKGAKDGLKNQAKEFIEAGHGESLANHAKAAGKGAVSGAKWVGGHLKDTMAGKAFGQVAKDFGWIRKPAGAAKDVFKKGFSGPGGGVTKTASILVDRMSRNMARLDENVEKDLNRGVFDGNANITQAAYMASAVDATDEDVMNGARSAYEASNQQLMDAQTIHDLGTYIEGEGNGNSQLVVDQDYAERIVTAHAVKENLPNAGARAKSVETQVSQFNDRVKNKGGIGGFKAKSPLMNNDKNRSKYLSAIHGRSQSLRSEYADVIQKYHSDGPKDAETMKKYSEYMAKAAELDDAYLYVNSGRLMGDREQEGREAFERLAPELRDGPDGKGNKQFAVRAFNEKQHLDDIVERAKEANSIAEDPEKLEAQASAATRLAASSQRLASANAHYETVMSTEGATKAEVSAARSKVQQSVSAVKSDSDRVMNEASNARNSIVETSKQNYKSNVGIKVKKAGKNSNGKTSTLESAIERAPLKEGPRRGAKRTATVDVQAKSKGATSSRTGSTSTQSSRPARSGNVSAPAQDELEITVNITDPEDVRNAIRDGVGSEGLQHIMEAYPQDSNGSSDEFIARVREFKEDPYSMNKQFSTALDNIQNESSIPDTYRGKMNVSEYRKDVEGRFNSATERYNNAMQQAKVLSDQHASNPNSEILSQVALSIQEAVLASREISSLKTELKIDKIKID